MFKKVLFPTDFSDESYEVANRFEKENSITIETLFLLHVVDESILEELTNGFSLLYNSETQELKDIEAKLKEQSLLKLTKEADEFKKMFKAINVVKIVEFGIPYKKIIEVSKRENVSLIILPSHGKQGFSEEFFGSTAARVIKLSDKPILVIKSKEVK